VAACLTPSVKPGQNEPTSFLPADTPSRVAVEMLGEHFGQTVGLSEAVIIFERRGEALTHRDLRAIEKIAARIARKSRKHTGRKDLEGVSVRSPRSFPLPRSPYISQATDRGQAALIKVNIPANFITARSARIVRYIRSILARESLPSGLSATVTGSGAFGLDYALAAKKSHRRTFIVTVIAVIVILMVVYRAPLAALVPLGAISIAAVIALYLLAAGNAYLGMTTGLAEKIFTVVLLYGAGTDYSLMLISRHREFLQEGVERRQATARALAATGPAILASAGTDIIGLLMLSFASYRLFQSAGPAIAMALLVALLAAVTLVPAVVALIGRRVYWPSHPVGLVGGPRARRPAVWRKVAQVVTSRPGTVLAVALAVLAVPAVRGARLTWVYDTLADLGSGYGAARGAQIAQRHWPIGEIAPVQVLISTSGPTSAEKWRDVSAAITPAIGQVRKKRAGDGVRDVRSLTSPLGENIDLITRGILALPVARKKVQTEYLSADKSAMRLEVVLDQPSLTLEAMGLVDSIRDTIAERLRLAGLDARIHLAGATAQMMDTRNVTGRDFYLIAGLALGVIFVIVWLLLRDAWLSAFMVASTVISYFAILGVSYWVFTGLFGAAGLDWKVRVFLFVVMVAVGQDYNIFLAARLSQEARLMEVRRATRHAIIHTGPVISSCGLIMAATLGSLMTGDIVLLKQLGFALALGMLVDTFLVRSLVLPAFVALTGRTGKSGRLRS